MIRKGMWAALVAASAMVTSLAPATGGEPENEDARFTFHRADDGYLRLDGRSGQVSLCVRRPVGWLCQAVPDERLALEAELSRLQADNATLKKELLAHNLSLPSGIKPDPQPSKVEAPRSQPLKDSKIKEMMSYIDKVWRRLVEMIVNVQRDILKKT
jgi:hypothetical protein